MSRAKLQEAKAPTEYWYLQPKFKTEEDAKAAAELLRGLCEGEVRVYEKKTRISHMTIIGQTVLDVFQVPNRSYHMEDIQIHLEERHFSAQSAQTTLTKLCREGVLKKLGPQTYFRPHDPTPSVRPDHNVETAVDGDLARLEQGQACGCGCGDEG